MGLPKHIIDAASRCGSERGTAEDVEVVRNWIEETQNINATYTLKAPWGDGRVTAEVRLLDDGALATLARVKLFNSLFGLPHALFKEVVSKL